MDDMISLIEFDSNAPSPPTKPAHLPPPFFSRPMTPGTEWAPIAPDTPKSVQSHSTLAPSVPGTPPAVQILSGSQSQRLSSGLKVTVDTDPSARSENEPPQNASITSPTVAPSSPGTSTNSTEASTLRATAQPFQRRRTISPAQALSFFPRPVLQQPAIRRPASPAPVVVTHQIRFRPPPASANPLRLAPFLQLPRSEVVSVKLEVEDVQTTPIVPASPEVVKHERPESVSQGADDRVMADMEENLARFQDAFAEYSVGFEENLCRLVMANATAPETATSPDKVQNDRAALLDAREQIQRLTLELKTQKSTTEEALDESKRSSARFDELSRRYIKLEDELLASRGGGATSESARIIVILHGTMNIFDDDFVAQGYSGGAEVSSILRDRLDEANSLTRVKDQSATIQVYLFIDPNYISAESTAFLRGFDEAHALNILCHPIAARGRWKVAAMIDLHLQDTSSDWIVLGFPEATGLIASLQSKAKFKAIRSRQDDLFGELLGAGSIIPVPGLFGNEEILSEPQTPRPTPKTLPPFSPTPTLKRAISPASSFSMIPSTSSVPPSPERPSSPVLPPSPNRSPMAPTRFSPSPNYPPYDIGPPPWHTGPPSTSGGSIIGSTTGGSLLDQYYASKTDTAASQSIPRMMIPYDPSIEGSIAGSPPESDEDEPSVALPHSAKKFVLRPVEFGAANEARPVTPHSEVSRNTTA